MNLKREEFTMSTNFGKRIIELMQKKQMTQKELADRIGTTEATISRYISGSRDPKSEVLANLATALNTTSDYLLGIEENGNPQHDIPSIKRLIARNAKKMTVEQKKELICALFED